MLPYINTLVRCLAGQSPICFGIIYPVSRSLLFTLFAAALTVPYLISIHQLPLASFHNELASGALWLGILLAVLLMPQLVPPTAFPRGALVPAGLVLVLLVQCLVMPVVNSTTMRIGIGYLTIATLLTYLGYRLRDLVGLTGLLAAAAIGGGLLSFGIEVVQALSKPGPLGAVITLGGLLVPRSARLFANLAQPNHLATYLSWGLGGACYLYQSGVLKWRAAAALLLLLLTAMVGTGSRIALGHVVLIGVVFGLARWYSLRSADGRAGWHIGLRAAALPIFLLLAYLLLDQGLAWIDRVAHLGLDTDAVRRMAGSGSLTGRLRLWNYGWHMFLNSPWLGGGWGGFPAWQYQRIETLGPVEPAISAHNIVLDLLGQTGLIGCGLFLLGMASWAWRARASALTWQRAFWFCLLGTVLAHALVEYPLNYTYFLFPAAFALGMLDTAPVRWWGLRSVRLPMLAGAILTPVLLASVLLMRSDINKIERFYQTPDLNAGMRRYWDNQAVLLNRYGAFAVAAAISVNGAHPEARLQMQRDAMNIMPMSGVVTNYIVTLALLGRDDEAMEQVKRMRLSEPDSAYPVNFALLLMRCDEQGSRLAKFTSKLQRMRPAGLPATVFPAKAGLADNVPASAALVAAAASAAAQ